MSATADFVRHYFFTSIPDNITPFAVLHTALCHDCLRPYEFETFSEHMLKMFQSMSHLSLITATDYFSPIPASLYSLSMICIGNATQPPLTMPGGSATSQLLHATPSSIQMISLHSKKIDQHHRPASYQMSTDEFQ